MPPKKNSDTTATAAKITKEKAPRKRAIKVKAEKPKLKTPTIVRMKLPPIKSLLNVGNRDPAVANENQGNQSPELTPAQKRKLDLANEVALAQLIKPDPDAQEKPVTKKTLKRPLVRKGTKSAEGPARPRGRSKKSDALESANEESVASYTESEIVSVPSKKKKEKGFAKKNANNIEKKTDSESEFLHNNTKRQKPDTTTKEVKVKRKYVRKPKVFESSDVLSNKKIPIAVCERKIAKPKTPRVKKNIRKGKMVPVDTDVSTTQDKSPCLLKEASRLIEDRLKDVDEDKDDSAVKTNSEEKTVPAPVDSRKTSVSECMSWTKDISSSSTTTCVSVGSNSIVRIDNKIPVLRLSNIGNEWKKVQETHVEKEQSDSEHEDANSTSSSSSSSSSSSKSSSISCRNSVRQSLNLSSSSVSPSKSFVTRTSVTHDEDWEYALKKLMTNLKKLDVEAIKWIGYENQAISKDIDIVQDKIFKLLKFENQVLETCQNINKTFGSGADGKDKDEISRHEQEKNSIDDPTAYMDQSDDDNFASSQSRYVMFDQTCKGDEHPLQVQSKEYDDVSEEENYESDVRDAALDQSNYNDDDDALSLFAESITGLESSRYNSSANSICANASEHEEYIPQPMVSREADGPRYVPTKISDSQNYRAKLICEKQNADSTSIYRDNDNYRAPERNENVGNNQTVNRPVQTVVRQVMNFQPRPIKKRVKLMAHVHKPIHCTKSIVFYGVCFYNLISNCKKMQCRYPHVQLDSLEIANRLAKLTEVVFIQEYMLLRNWPTLRRLYGRLYVNECIRRKLTNILVEMTIDFITKSKTEDSVLKTVVAEEALLYLNDVDLSTCEDLLQYDFGDNKLLCGELMRFIASTLNFARFKPVFLKLTNFMNEIRKKFDSDVAINILERVCILNCEESLARAMLTIIANTDVLIFENSMMGQFEKQLSILDPNMYDELCLLRERAMQGRVSFSNEHVLPPMTNQGVDMMMHTEAEERYTSPDTTKLDNSNKQNEESSQNVKIIRPSIYNHLFNTNASTSKQNDDNRNWQGQGNTYKSPSKRGRGFRRPYHNGMTRPLLKRRLDNRQVEFGNTPPKFGRRSGPDYF